MKNKFAFLCDPFYIFFNTRKVTLEVYLLSIDQMIEKIYFVGLYSHISWYRRLYFPIENDESLIKKFMLINMKIISNQTL